MKQILILFTLFMFSFQSNSQIEKVCQDFQMVKVDTNNLGKSKFAILKFEENIKSSYQLSNSELDSFRKKLILECPKYAKAVLITKNIGVRNNEVKPLTDEESFRMLCRDSLENNLIQWSKKEKKEQIKKCDQEVKKMTKDSYGICKCGIDNLSESMNYETFINYSEYQQGRAVMEFYNKKCK